MSRYRAEINNTIKEALGGDITKFSSSFVVELECESKGSKTRNHFAVHHIIPNYPIDEKLRSWAKAEAMVPWVAVATELPVSLIS
jgi:hypothetical protein